MRKNSRTGFKTGAILIICALVIVFNIENLAASADSIQRLGGKNKAVEDIITVNLTSYPDDRESQTEILPERVKKHIIDTETRYAHIAESAALDRNSMKRIEKNIEKALKDRIRAREQTEIIEPPTEAKHTNTPTNRTATAKNYIEKVDDTEQTDFGTEDSNRMNSPRKSRFTMSRKSHMGVDEACPADSIPVSDKRMNSPRKGRSTYTCKNYIEVDEVGAMDFSPMDFKHINTPTNSRRAEAVRNYTRTGERESIITTLKGVVNEDGSVSGTLPLSLLPQLAISLIKVLNRESFADDPLGIDYSENYLDLICECDDLIEKYNNNFDTITKRAEIARLISPLKKVYQEISIPMMDMLKRTPSKELFEDLRELDDILNLIALFALHRFNTLLPSPHESKNL